MDDRERQAQALQETLHHEIPLSQAMGLTVSAYDGASLTLRAPPTSTTNPPPSRAVSTRSPRWRAGVSSGSSLTNKNCPA